MNVLMSSLDPAPHFPYPPLTYYPPPPPLNASSGIKCMRYGIINGKDCRMSKNFLPKPSPSKSRLLLHLSRGQMRRLIELITKHSNLNYVQSKIDPFNIFPYVDFVRKKMKPLPIS